MNNATDTTSTGVGTSEQIAAAGRDAELRRRLVAVAADYQDELVRLGSVPDPERVITRRLQGLLVTVFTLLIAMNVATATVLGTFLVFNKILHWEF